MVAPRLIMASAKIIMMLIALPSSVWVFIFMIYAPFQ
jgi:hypothetical protein